MRSVELFAGAGGLGMGAAKSGFQHLAVLDWDKWACETIRENRDRGGELLAGWPVHECDVRDFDFSAITKSVDLLTAGPPCQPFSLGGRHQSHLDRRDMFPQAIRAVRELAPKAFVIENVKGLTRESFISYFEYIRLQLRHPEIVERKDEAWADHYARLKDYQAVGEGAGLHYDLVSMVLNAANYGIPQKRERVFLVGFRADTGINWHFPERTHSRDALLWSQWQDGSYWVEHKISKKDRSGPDRDIVRASKLRAKPDRQPWLTVRNALFDLPDPEFEPDKAAFWLNHKFMPGARSYPGHTGSPLDQPAKTLKAGVHGVPGGENMLRRPDGSIRYFSVREAARLQTFPDEFVFPGSWTENMRLLGNAVPLRLAEIVITSVKDALKRT